MGTPRRVVDRKPESPDLSARAFLGAVLSVFAGRSRSGDDAEPGAHQSDAVEIGLFAGAFLGALARLVALI